MSTKSHKKILLLGDFFLDEFFKGTSDRLSPEAAVPVIKYQSSKISLGGTGNVLANLVNLKNEVVPIGVLGDDTVSNKILSLIKRKKINTKHFLIKKNYKGILKKRILIKNQHVARIDYENESSNINKFEEKKIISKIKSLIKKTSIIIISDYGKNSLNDKIIKYAITISKKHNVVSIVDPSKTLKNYLCYAGADFITPNLLELRNLYFKLDNEDKDIIKACKNLKKKYKFKNILVTRGEKGITLFNKNLTKHFISKVKSVFDVSGAGDTVVSVLATCINMKMSLSNSANYANIAGGHVVSLTGTQPISFKKFKEIIKI